MRSDSSGFDTMLEHLVQSPVQWRIGQRRKSEDALYHKDKDCSRPPETFTSRLSTIRSPSPTLDMTTTSTGLLCRRDLHPLEWQLQQIPVKLTHSRHVESSCGILHEKASVRKHRRGGVEHEQSARKIFADRL